MSGGERADQFAMADGGQSHGCDTPAARTIGITTELAGLHLRLELSGDGFRRFGKNTLIG